LVRVALSVEKEPVRICLASWAPFLAGAEIAAERLAVGLQEAGHEVFVVLGTRGPSLRRMEEAGLSCFYLPLAMTDKWRPWRYWRAQRALARLLARLRPDVVHANDLPTSQMVAQAAGKLGIPRICHHRWIFDGPAIHWLNKFGAERHLFVSNALMEQLLAASMSENGHQQNAKSGNPSLPTVHGPPSTGIRPPAEPSPAFPPRQSGEGKSSSALFPRAVVYDGLPIPPLASDQERKAAREELIAEIARHFPSTVHGPPSTATSHSPLAACLWPDKVVVTIAGQVIERKGHADLIRAWAKLSPEAAGRAELVVVGDDLQDGGAYRKQMEQLARQLQVPARFVGFQKNVARWLTASDIAAVPSHVEPLGNATLEAMALGLPVIGGSVGGIPEMVVNGRTGLLVPPKSPEALAAALERLILDADLRRRLGAAGRKRCEEKFSLKAHVEAVVDQYRAVIGLKGTVPCSRRKG
jgi:glycosyltransferase involved in cell wall biosynthesis